MQERDEIVEELKHLTRYYRQAAREFFDDTSNELDERLDGFYKCLEKDKNSLEDYKKMVEYLTTLQASLKKRVGDLGFLTDKMNQLFDAP